jgi:hypothetical protein
VIDFRIYKNREIADQLENCLRLPSHVHEVRYPGIEGKEERRPGWKEGEKGKTERMKYERKKEIWKLRNVREIVVWTLYKTQLYKIYCHVLSNYRRVLDWSLDLLDSHTTRDYTSHIFITHRLVFSVTLLGSGFQRLSFLYFRAHVFSRWLPSHASHILWPLASVCSSLSCWLLGWTDLYLPTSNYSCQFSTGFRAELTNNAKLTPYATSARTAENTASNIYSTVAYVHCSGIVAFYTAIA